MGVDKIWLISSELVNSIKPLGICHEFQPWALWKNKYTSVGTAKAH